MNPSANGRLWRRIASRSFSAAVLIAVLSAVADFAMAANSSNPGSSGRPVPGASISVTGWEGFIGQTLSAPETNLSPLLNIDLTEERTRAALAQVMTSARLNPENVGLQPTLAAKAQMIRHALGVHAAETLWKTENVDPKNVQAVSALHLDLRNLQAVADALPEGHKNDVVRAVDQLKQVQDAWDKAAESAPPAVLLEEKAVRATGEKASLWKKHAVLEKPAATAPRAEANSPEVPAATVAKNWTMDTAEEPAPDLVDGLSAGWWAGPAFLYRPMFRLAARRTPVLGGLAARWLHLKFSQSHDNIRRIAVALHPFQDSPPDNSSTDLGSLLAALESPYPKFSAYASKELQFLKIRPGRFEEEMLAGILAKSDDPRVRVNAIAAISESEITERLLRIVLDQLKHPDLAVRIAAAQRLSNRDVAHPAVAVTLFRALNGPDIEVRNQATVGLAARGRPPTSREAIDLISAWKATTEHGPRDRVMKAWALSDSLPTEVVDFLASLKKSLYSREAVQILLTQKSLPDSVRDEALKTIEAAEHFYTPREAWFTLVYGNYSLSRKAMEYLRSPRTVDQALEKIVISAMTSPIASVRSNALAALAEHRLLPKSVSDTAIRLMDSSDVDTRRQAAHLMLHRLKSEGTGDTTKVFIDAFRKAKFDPDLEVRLIAAFALQMQTEIPPALYGEIVAAFKHKDAAVRQYAVHTMGLIPQLPAEILSYLSEALDDPDEPVRRDAITALVASKNPSDDQLRLIARALSNRDTGVSYVAQERLAQLRDRLPTILPELTQALKSDVEGQRAAGLLMSVPFLTESAARDLLTLAFDDPQAHRLAQGRARAVLAMKSMPAPLRDGVVERLKKASDTEQKEALVNIVAYWATAGQLVDILYPDLSADLLELIPDLTTMEANGFSNSLLGKRQTAVALIENVRDLRSMLGPRHYLAAIGPLKSPRGLAAWVAIAPPYTDYAAAEFSYPYPIPGQASVETYHPGQVAAVSASDGATEGRDRLAKTYEAFDALIDRNFRALETLAKSAGALDKKTAREVLEHAAQMIESYHLVTGERNAALDAKFEEIRAELEALWAKLPDRSKLPKSISSRVAELEPAATLGGMRNLHTLINYVHQQSFKALSAETRRVRADGRIVLGSRQIPLINLGTEPLTNRARIENPLLRLVAGEDTPNAATVILRDDQLWLHAQLGSHSVEIHVKLAEPDEGGLLQIRYSEGGDDAGNQLRLLYIGELLRLIGSSPDIQGNQYLNLSWDKDHGLLSRTQIEQALPKILKAFNNTTNLDWALQGIQKKKGFPVARDVARHMAATHIAEGSIPYLVKVNAENSLELYRGYERYLRRADNGKTVRARLNRELTRLGLLEIPLDIPFGQNVINERFRDPILRAVARGEFVLDEKGLPQRIEYHPVDELARKASREEAAALSLASAVAATDMTGLHFEPLGSVGRLLVERGQWLEPGDRGVVVYVLRDPQTRAIAYARARRWKNGELEELDAATFVAELQRRGIDASLGTPLGRIQTARWRRLLTSAPLEETSATMARGLAASSGRGAPITGRVFFRKDDGGIKNGIFIAPFTTPDDLVHMRRSAAVVTTGGGLLSHAGITTRELQIPAVILSNARWLQIDGETILEVEIPLPQGASQGPGGLWVVDGIKYQRLRIREGDVLRVDGARGFVTIFEPAPTAAVWSPSANDEISQFYGIMNDIREGRSNARALGAKLGRLRGPPQAAAGQFVFEEALWNPAFAAHRDAIVKTVLSSSRDLRAGLKDYAARFIRMRLAQIELEDEPGQDVSDKDVMRLKSQLAELSAMSEALSLEPALLKPLRQKVTEWESLSETLKRRARETLEAAARAWSARLHDLQESDLAGLRSFFRRLRGTDIEGQLAHMRARADELSRIKKQAILARRPSVIDLEYVDDDLVDLVGGKSAKLGEIMKIVLKEGGYVPPGVALTTDAYLRFLRETGIEARAAALAEELDRELASADLDSDATLRFIRQKSDAMRELIKSVRLNPETGLGREIIDGLKARGLGDSLFAVRSSAVQEDGAEAAFAGAAETSLYVDADTLLEKVVENWASFWLPRGIQYRRQQNIRSQDLRPAVTIQKMANPEAAGVMFTVNPVTGKPEIVINAAFGLGEGVVSGLVQADQYTANRDGEEIAPATLGSKKVKIVRKASGPGTETKRVPEKERRRRSLTPEQVRDLTRIGIALENHFGYPLDIEFAIEEGRIVILQARPVTTSGR